MKVVSFVLVGPNAGKSFRHTEFGVPFIDGEATLPPHNIDNLCLAMERGWNAFLKGSHAHMEAQKEWENRCGRGRVSGTACDAIGSEAVDSQSGTDGSPADAGTSDGADDVATPAASEESEAPTDNRPGANQSLEQLLDALDHEDNSVWTTTGLPRLDVLAQRLGRPVSRRDVVALRPDLKRDDL